MKKFIGLAVAALIAAAPAQAQLTDGASGTATFTGNVATTNAPWFQFDVTTDAFSGNVDFVCVDANVYVYRNTLYDVTFHDLALGGTSIAGYDINNLIDAAWAYDAIASNPDLQGDLGAQLAIWDFMGTRAGSYYGSTDIGGSAAYATVRNHVLANRHRGLDFGGYTYLLMTGTNQHRGTMQPQLTRIDVPEPGTTFLLASGLLGLFAVGFRRKKISA